MLFTVQLTALLNDKVLDVCSGLSMEAGDYDKLQKVLLQRYEFTKQGYRKRYRNTKLEDKKNLIS